MFNFKIFESLSKNSCHFTDADGLYSILTTNEFKLSPITKYHADNKINTHKYYMSISRSSNVYVGFPLTMFDNGNYCIKLDLIEEKFNNNFKSVPYDYWHNGIDYKAKLLRSKASYEYEDRIISNKEIIKNAISYISGISVILSDYSSKFKDLSNIIGEEISILNDEIFDNYNIKYYKSQKDYIKKIEISRKDFLILIKNIE